jgi:hypothetical protein
MSYPYLYPIEDLAQKSLHRGLNVYTDQGSFSKKVLVQGSLGFHVCTDQGSFLIIFLTNNELRVNDDVSDYVGANDDVSDDANDG